MTYSDPVTLSDNGDLHIPTLFGDIIDHAPETFYTGNSSLPINSKFILTGKSVGFTLDPYDNTKSVTIDPWVESPTFTTSTAVWEVEADGSGNVYVIGGETPMELKKYNSAGTIQWTYTTPWDTATVWLGTLATDNLGNSYITSGTAPEMERINNAGGMVWHNNGNAFNNEWWSITFNCDKTKLIVGGTTLNMIPNFEGYATIFDMDINNGNVLASQNFAYTDLSVMFSFPVEVRSISSSKNAQYIFLTHNDVGAINQNIGVCPTDEPIFQLDNGHNLAYKCENYLPATQNGGGLKALVANDQFFYTHSGDQIHKRSLTDGSLISSVAIPGGANSTDIFGSIIVENSGLAVDAAGNVYAGSTNQVVKYDANLNILSQAAVTFCVYDVSVNSNGEVLAVGAQQDNQSANRNGRIQSLAMSAGGQYALVCCDANICPVDTVCTTDAAFNLSSSSSGGTWTGTGITNASLGTFDPAGAGEGTWTITYTQACGTGTVDVVVLACATLTICQETNGDLTVSGGTGPYNWQELVPGSPTPITNSAECTACGYTWLIFQCLDGNMDPTTSCPGSPSWSNFAIGTTVTPPVGADTIQVTDASLNSTVVYDISTLPMCTPCPTINITPSNIVQVLCFGQSTGSFTASGSGGASPYDYTLMLGVTTIATYSNVSGSQNFTGLAAGTYTLNIVDDNSCPGTITVVITQPASAVVAAITGSTPPSCGMSDGSATASGSGGTGPYTYSWNSSPVQNTATASNLPAGNYIVTVTDASSCSATTNVTLTNPNAPTLATNTVNATCGQSNGQAIVTASGGAFPYTYQWSTVPVQNTQAANNLAPGTYYVTVTDALNCTSIDSATVIDTSSFSADAGPNQAVCTGDSVTLTATGGTTYQWSTGASTASVNVMPSVTTLYTVTVSDGACTATDTVTVSVNAVPAANITGDTLICTGATVTLTASGGSSYIWNTSETTAAITVSPLSATTYNVTVSNAGCSSTADITINLSTPPTANAGNDTTINIGGSAQLDGSGGVSFSWSPVATLSCSNCADPSASPLSTTTYVLVITDANGCTDVDTVIVTVDMNCGEVFVPNAFSPNSDGQNELECVYGNCIQTMEFAIYDRWGEKVFETTNPKECWDGTYKGKELNTGAFVYYMKATLYDGSEVTRQGNINLFR
ncbi:MAG: gliding motility-associated C-terminal domain-containing protein [Bacteroidota bacterium]